MKIKSNFTKLLLSMLWLLAVAVGVGRFFIRANWLDVFAGLASFFFIITLIWGLSREKPATVELPDLEISSRHQPSFWISTLLIFLGLGCTFILGLMIGTGFSPLLICSLLGLGITVAWRKSIQRDTILLGLSAGLISAIGIAYLGTGDNSWAIANLFTIPPSFIGGVLLLQRTRLGHVRALEGDATRGLKSFLIGCLLAIPAVSLNLLGNMQVQDSWVVHWWQPLYAAVPAIAEESWARLFLVSFCYAVLRPVTNQRPHRAVIVAIIVSLLAHGFAHTGIDPFGILIGSALYSLPVALLFIKRDFEHAVVYHFAIDFIRFIAAYLSTQV